jgi:hypothetical protein
VLAAISDVSGSPSTSPLTKASSKLTVTSPMSSGSLMSSAQTATFMTLPPFFGPGLRDLDAMLCGVTTPGSPGRGLDVVADSMSSTSSWMGKRSSSSHSGCCPPLLVSKGLAEGWAAKRLSAARRLPRDADWTP